MSRSFNSAGRPPVDAHPRGHRRHRAGLLHGLQVPRTPQQQPEVAEAAVDRAEALLPRGPDVERFGVDGGLKRPLHVRRAGGGDGGRLRRAGRAHRLPRAHRLLRGQELLRGRSQPPGL